MGIESEPGSFRVRVRSRGRSRGRGRGIFNKILSSSSCNQDIKFVTTSRKQVYTYTAVKDIIVQKVQKAYVYEMESSLRDLEEYETEVERPTRIMSLETDPNMKETNKIGLDMLYQADITNYINTIK